MDSILEFESSFTTLLPETHTLLAESNLTVHSSISRIILHGSRGPAQRNRPDSDIDLSLIVEIDPTQPDLEGTLHQVFDTTKQTWKGSVELDLAVVFDTQACGLKCFEHAAWTEGICPCGGVDCFGLYKIGKGFNGLVEHAGIQVRQMYPCIKIWQRK